MGERSGLVDIMERRETEILDAWLADQPDAEVLRSDLLGQRERREHATSFLRAFKSALLQRADDTAGASWEPVRALLKELSGLWTQRGLSPTETSMFVMSFKQPIFEELRRKYADRPDALVDEAWNSGKLLDQLALYVAQVHLLKREETIARQRQEVLELSTPVVEVWDGILALPVIGVLDSARTQQVMETLLNRIVETQAEIAILDITGVPTVDSATAQHLVKTATAVRFMGAECIISGIRPQIAQTMVTLGLDFGGLHTQSTMAAALQWATARGTGSEGRQSANDE